MSTPIDAVGEFGLIDQLVEAWAEGASTRADQYERLCQLLGSKVIGPFPPRLAVGDDGAILDIPPQRPLLTTTDMLVEGVHFLWSSERISSLGRKALAVNISDIAAMGGVPSWAFLSIAVPRKASVEDVRALYYAMGEIAGCYGITLAGGDTVQSDKWVINVTLLGLAIKEPVRRSGGEEGDLIAVTGSLGDSAAGLHLLLSSSQLKGAGESYLLQRHLEPTPRVMEASILVQQDAVKAMLDISDGLSSEIHHLCRQSQCGALIDLSALPISEEAQSLAHSIDQSALDWALSGGEDFELLFTIAREKAESLQELIHNETGTAISFIGELRNSSEGIRIYNSSNKEKKSYPLEARGYNHFSGLSRTE
ncbi:thiamine-phosphate kinase [Heliorestis acidaminivorans]|uniref:Thiamine-monophosphate kinase n=1 Tax=Heliorestis acidaminivorans TaxID=553427 RepID=A0A6I0F211_9FIRM|nr:thiamine-phosphate kinase [Heliorestis acidaminivorans]KAB2953358.1 thiamine-phosphate kinase [Heliorestis acidaminivorans]